eukprot:1311298-Prymnesium_polylepis.1
MSSGCKGERAWGRDARRSSARVRVTPTHGHSKSSKPARWQKASHGTIATADSAPMRPTQRQLPTRRSECEEGRSECEEGRSE